MAPQAPATPKTPVKTRAAQADATPTQRRSPHCKACGRPRKGHPLRSCDLNLGRGASPAPKKPAPSPAPSSVAASSIAPSSPPVSAASGTIVDYDSDSDSDSHTSSPDQRIAAKLGALSLSPGPGLASALAADSTAEARDKRTRRTSLFRQQYTHVPADLQSLPSISTITGELLDGLTMMSPPKAEAAIGLCVGEEEEEDDQDGEQEKEKREAILQWRDANGTPRRVRFTPAAAAAEDGDGDDETTPTKAGRKPTSKGRN
ncbi:hypothetical protein MKEN_00150100 [Mycena kentingensis (nom. inval.)]|nr:hypothetical protein MKEN_00150100 [Mycena kentingensis (nom. inval.)]